MKRLVKKEDEERFLRKIYVKGQGSKLVIFSGKNVDELQIVSQNCWEDICGCCPIHNS